MASWDRGACFSLLHCVSYVNGLRGELTHGSKLATLERYSLSLHLQLGWQVSSANGYTQTPSVF